MMHDKQNYRFEKTEALAEYAEVREALMEALGINNRNSLAAYASSAHRYAQFVRST